jgi:hypothetical protein
VFARSKKVLKRFHFVSSTRRLLVCAVLACGPIQCLIDSSLDNILCTIIAIMASIGTFLYVFDVRRFRRTPFSCVMVLGFNVSVFSAAILIQTSALRSLTYNLSSGFVTFTALAETQLLVIFVHFAYSHSQALKGLRISLSRYVFGPIGLLKPPSNLQLWLLGFIGCIATVIAARNYTDAMDYGDVSGKFLLGYTPFAVAPFFIPLRDRLFGASKQSGSNWLAVSAYAVLLIAVAMANNARATFSSGFLTLALTGFIAILGGNLNVTRKGICRGIVLAVVAVPVFSTLSDLSTAMLIARDQRSNVSSLELIEITLSNFQNTELLQERRRRDALVLNGEYNEIYVSNAIFSRFVYTKFVDVNMTNAMLLSDNQAEEIRKTTWQRVLALLPTPVIRSVGIDVDKSDLGFSSGDIYSFIARGLERGGFTTGSEIPDGLTIFGHFFWPVLAFLVVIQFVIYDALSVIDKAGKLLVSAVALLNVVPIFTLGVMQESVANQIAAILRGFPQLILLYLVVMVPSSIIASLLAARRYQRRAIGARQVREF